MQRLSSVLLLLAGFAPLAAAADQSASSLSAVAPAAVPTSATRPMLGSAGSVSIAAGISAAAAATIGGGAPPPAAASTEVTPDADEGSDDSDADDDTPDDAAPPAQVGEAEGGEGEEHANEAPSEATGRFYTGDISDAELMKIWKTKRASLGTVSVGFTDAGRLINAEQFPMTGGPWVVVDPPKTWATHETIDFLTSVFRAVDKQFPGGPPGRVNHISAKDGGWMRPHRSHQSGRDVDIGFYYKDMPGARVRDRSRYMDLARNWSFIRNIVATTDVQMILVDRTIQRTLYKYALSQGEDRAWLDTLFHAGAASLIKHARHHRDHFHVRFYNAYAQELGRRIQPLLALDKDAHSTIMHRIRSGDSLGRIAMHYGVSITALKKANGLRSVAIRAGHMLAIPVRGACVNCPIPPPVIVPPRRVPPPPALPQVSARESGTATGSLL
jgi:murein endopeptidase